MTNYQAPKLNFTKYVAPKLGANTANAAPAAGATSEGGSMFDPVSATIMGVGTIISGLMGMSSTEQAAEQSAEAQRYAADLQNRMYERQLGEGIRQFNIQNALENVKLKWTMDQAKLNQKALEEQTNYQRAMDFSNKIVNMGQIGSQRGQGLSSLWAGMSRVPTVSPV